MTNLEKVIKAVMVMTILALVVTLIAVALGELQFVGWGLGMFMLLLTALGQVDHQSTLQYRRERERQEAKHKRASMVQRTRTR